MRTYYLTGKQYPLKMTDFRLKIHVFCRFWAQNHRTSAALFPSDRQLVVASFPSLTKTKMQVLRKGNPLYPNGANQSQAGRRLRPFP
jgi:hypothetical protein